MSSTRTVAFFGASGGVGLSALKHTLAAGHNCIALCRTPSKLTDILPLAKYPNLTVVPGNAHDIAAVSKTIRKVDGNLVDEIVTTIGARPNLSKMKLLDDPEVCRKGMTTLLKAITQLRSEGAMGRPRISACSTTGMSRFGRDVPVMIAPIWNVMLKVPHADKLIMEDTLIASGEDWTVVRCSYLSDGESNKTIRVGIEDPKTGVESRAIGYSISREDAGKWFAQNLLLNKVNKYVNKTVTITY